MSYHLDFAYCIITTPPTHPPTLTFQTLLKFLPSSVVPFWKSFINPDLDCNFSYMKYMNLDFAKQSKVDFSYFNQFQIPHEQIHK